MLRRNKKGQMTWEQLAGGLLVLLLVSLLGYLAYKVIYPVTESVSLVPNAFPTVCQGLAGQTALNSLDDYCKFRTEGSSNLYYNCLYPPVQAAIKAAKVQQNRIDCGVSPIYKPSVKCAEVCALGTGDASKVNAGTVKFDGVKYKCPPAGGTECTPQTGQVEVAMNNDASMGVTTTA